MCTVCARLAFLFPRAAPPKMLEKHGFRQGRGFLPSKRIEIMAFSNRMFLLRRRIPFNNNACMQGHRIFLSLFVESLSLPSEVLHSREKSPFCFSPPPSPLLFCASVRPSGVDTPAPVVGTHPSSFPAPVRGGGGGGGGGHRGLVEEGGGRAGVNELGEETNGKGRAKEEEGIGGGSAVRKGRERGDRRTLSLSQGCERGGGRPTEGRRRRSSSPSSSVCFPTPSRADARSSASCLSQVQLQNIAEHSA